jgi:uncharacterized protein
MSANKKVVEDYLGRAKRAEVSPFLTEDAEWVEYAEGVPSLGVRSRGKAAWIHNLGDAEFRTETHRLTEEGNVVVAEGTARGTSKEGTPWAVRFVDVFEFENGKIRRMTSIGAMLKDSA